MPRPIQKLIAVSVLALGLFALPNTSQSKGKNFPKGDGTLRLYNYHLDEFAEIQFRQNGRLLPEGVAQINHLFRSRDNSETVSMDPRLLDLLDHLQDHFDVDTVEIISAYRRKELNEALLKEGHEVSPGSLHMKGQAVDFHMDEIREETLRDYLTGLGLGGVGYYGPLDFIHVDTGPVRSWGGSEPFAQKLIGIVQADSPVQLTSDKNDYLPDEKLYFTWQFKKGYRAKKISDIELEHFWRGKWIPCPGQATPENQSILPTSSLFCPSESEKTGYGKYRWIFRVKGEAQPLSSNEFYLKKE